MKYTLEELKSILMVAIEEENQPLINSCAQDIARMLCDYNPKEDYNQLLCQYGYQSINERRL